MSETKQERIERLKENLRTFERLTEPDRQLFCDLPAECICWLNGLGEWRYKCSTESFSSLERYQIISSYQPEPDTPVFPGYVLCEVKPDSRGWLRFYTPTGTEHWTLDVAPRLGCCGYVPKEEIGGDFTMVNNPVFYVDKKRTCWSDLLKGGMAENGWSAGVLGWVCFQEESK